MRTYILILEFYHLLGYIPRHNSKIPLVLYLPSTVPSPYLLPLVPIVLVYSPHSPIPVYQCPPPLPQISSPSPLRSPLLLVRSAAFWLGLRSLSAKLAPVLQAPQRPPSKLGGPRARVRA